MMIDREAIVNIVGRNHSYPSPPQYKVSDRAAALLTVASPKRTRTMLGKQHIDAMMVDIEMILTKDLTFFSSSSMLTPHSKQSAKRFASLGFV